MGLYISTKWSKTGFKCDVPIFISSSPAKISNTYIIQIRGQRLFQGSWGYDCDMILLVYIVVLLCDPFRNIRTKLK